MADVAALVERLEAGLLDWRREPIPDDNPPSVDLTAGDFRALVGALQAQAAENAQWRAMARETFGAMVAMRNSINEHVPLPSLESDLAEGPSNAVFCEVVARAVIERVTALQRELCDTVPMTSDDHNALHSLASTEARAEAAEAKLREAVEVLRRIEPYLDAIVNYADTMDEYEPNRIAYDARAFLATMEKQEDGQ